LLLLTLFAPENQLRERDSYPDEPERWRPHIDL
jgi:hypothetical protein